MKAKVDGITDLELDRVMVFVVPTLHLHCSEGHGQVCALADCSSYEGNQIRLRVGLRYCLGWSLELEAEEDLVGSDLGSLVVGIVQVPLKGWNDVNLIILGVGEAVVSNSRLNRLVLLFYKAVCLWMVCSCHPQLSSESLP